MSVKLLRGKAKNALKAKFGEVAEAKKPDVNNFTSKRLIAAQKSGKRSAVEAVQRTKRVAQTLRANKKTVTNKVKTNNQEGKA